MPLEGVNLYNNGFSGGMIAIVLYPFIRAVFQWKRPDFQTAEYYDVFEEDTPVAPRERDWGPRGPERKARKLHRSMRGASGRGRAAAGGQSLDGR